MNSHIKLTDASVQALALTLEEGDRRYFYDLGLTGLALQVTRFKKCWYVYKSFRRKPLKYKLGEFPVMSADKARSEAIRVIADLEKGIHPQEARRKSESEVHTLAELFERYLNEYLQPHTKSWDETSKSFKRHALDLMPRQLESLTKSDVQKWINKIGLTVGKQTADRNYNTLRACLRWGMQNDLFVVAKDPTKFIKLFRVIPQKEILLKSDWKKIKPVLERQPQIISDIIYMLLYTAARKSNVLKMEWKEINMSARIWTIPPEKSKNGRVMMIPLTEDAMAILERRGFQTRQTGYVFPSEMGNTGYYTNIDRPWRKIREEAGISKRVTIHDLRHTTCSWMGMTGANGFEIKDAAGHSSIATTMGYTHLQKDGIRNAMKRAYDALQEDEQTA